MRSACIQTCFGLLCAVFLACAPAADLQEAEDLHAAAAPELRTARGDLSTHQSRRILESLARQAGVSQMLLHHVAVEEAYTASPLVTGNKVTLLRDGAATYRSMDEAIRQARHHINLEVYTFADDQVGREVAEALVARMQAGVQVNIIYDSVGCLATNPEFFEYLRRWGARLVEFNPVSPASVRKEWKVDHRDHRKLLIVDNRIAFTGGLNFAREYSGGSFRSSGGSGGSGGGSSASGGASSGGSRGDAWRDTHVRIEGPVVAEFQKLFRETWEKQHGQAIDWGPYFVEAPPAGDQIVRAIGSTPDHGISVIHATFVSAIQRAEKSVYLTQMYFVPDSELVQEVVEAARRGVDVQIILPAEGFWMTRYAGRSHYRALLEAGVKIHEREGPLLHAKTAVIDGVWSTVGSTNLDYRSLAKNDEVNAVILGEDFAAQLEAMFRDDVAASRPITLGDWKRRGPATRFKEGAARIWERLL
ncbi:MAG TPA: phospholipase D-like domain-containing protein [Candidatus Limnocylindrales bacterium]|nr:phospholipase D-like domain-containing protein [Candidatus Limnocylindrales bacterium]